MFGSISFFVNAGIRFVEEICKLRAFVELWDRIGLERYGVEDPKARRFRYGVQVNSLGLTEAQPENNVQRIVLEMLAVTLSKAARARSIQLPAWNEALGLPHPWDQQWSLRMQQVLAFESDLLEYEDLFDGSHVVEARTAELVDAARAELDDVLSMGGAFDAVETLKAPAGGVDGRAHAADRVRRPGRRRRQPVHRDRAVAARRRGGDPARRPGRRGRDDRRRRGVAGGPGRATRCGPRWRTLRRVAASDENVMPASIALARAGGTTGEWGTVMREVFGEFRAPTGVGGAAVAGGGLGAVAERVKAMPGGPPKFLVAKPGLDGHSNGAEQIAVAARDAGMEVVYSGIRLTSEQIAASARDEDPDVIGLSILSGSHLELVPGLLDELRALGVDAPVVVGGIIPEGDRPKLAELGVAAVYTPKDFELARIMSDIADLAEAHRAE